ncbi:hypothetical protein A2U01_0073575, partial [Trifolium medium]|nr:hypothetical protein [Trifolium medium]
MIQSKQTPECYQVDLIDTLIKEQQETPPPAVERVLVQSIEQEEEWEDAETNLSVKWLEDPAKIPS